MQADKDTHLVFTSLVLLTHCSIYYTLLGSEIHSVHVHWRQFTKCVPAL